MNANDPVISQPITCKLSCINRNSDQIIPNVEIFHNCLKLPFFGLKIRLLFTDLFRIRFRIRIRIRIRNVYFGSGSVSDPAKSFGSLRIRFRIRIRICNTASLPLCTIQVYCTFFLFFIIWLWILPPQERSSSRLWAVARRVKSHCASTGAGEAVPAAPLTAPRRTMRLARRFRASRKRRKRRRRWGQWWGSSSSVGCPSSSATSSRASVLRVLR